MQGERWLTVGGLGSGSGSFNSPRGLFIDAAGCIYVADRNNHRIVRLPAMTPVAWATLGSLGSGARQFKELRSIFTR